MREINDKFPFKVSELTHMEIIRTIAMNSIRRGYGYIFQHFEEVRVGQFKTDLLKREKTFINTINCLESCVDFLSPQCALAATLSGGATYHPFVTSRVLC